MPTTDPTYIIRELGEIKRADGETILGVVLEGNIEAIRDTGKMFGQSVRVVPSSDVYAAQDVLAALKAILVLRPLTSSSNGLLNEACAAAEAAIAKATSF